MARTPIAVTTVSRFVYTPNTTGTTGDTVNGMIVEFNDGATWLEFVSTSGSQQTVTVAVPSNVDITLPVTGRTFTIPANGSGKTGWFPAETFGSELLITVSSALVKIAAYTFG